MEARRYIIKKESQILCTRLCHDLLGPVGALGMGLELLESSPSPEIWSLVHSNIKILKAKIIFFRAALGKEDSSLSYEKIKDLLLTYNQFTKLKIQFPPPPQEYPPHFYALFLYFFLIIPEFLPRGGDVVISFSEKTIHLILQGLPCLTPPAFKKILEKTPLDLSSPKEIFYAFLSDSLALNKTELDIRQKKEESCHIIINNI